jgi:predicted aspartyl protease
MRGCLPILLLLVLAGTPAAASEGEPWVSFDLLPDGGVVVPVTIGGTGPFRFVVDTGSNRSAITTEVARRLNLRPAAHTVMVTPGGRRVCPLVHVSGLSIGAESWVDRQVVVVPAGEIAASRRIDGLIGQDVLAGLIYTIDYRRRRFVRHDNGGMATGAARLALTVADGRALVSLPQTSGHGAMLRLVPDSGADGLVLFRRGDGPAVPVTTLDTAGLRTLAGARLVRRVLVDVLEVGGLRLRDQVAVLVDGTEAGDLLGDGLLPLHLFARVTFNGPAGYLVVEPK